MPISDFTAKLLELKDVIIKDLIISAIAEALSYYYTISFLRYSFT